MEAKRKSRRIGRTRRQAMQWAVRCLLAAALAGIHKNP